MSNAAVLGDIVYEAESSWAEDLTSFTTHRVAITAPVDVSGLEDSKVPSNFVAQYRNDGFQYIRTTQGGSFKTRLHWCGHGSTMVGSPTVAAHETLLAAAFGSTADLSASASTTLTGGTASVPTTTASGTFDAGGLCRIGTLGDGDGDGQIFAITTHVTTSLTLRGDLNGAPVNGAVLYPVVQLYGPEAPTTSAITGLRFLLQTANLQYECHGCFPMSIAQGGMNPGETPWIEITWGVSWWRYSTATFPATTSSNTFLPGAIAAGSWNFQVSGTTTRNTRAYTNFTLEHTLGVVPIMGPGGVSARQKIVGARRIPDKIKITWTELADAATTSPVLPGYGTGTSFYHGEFTGSTADGSVFGFACPRMCVTNVAIQKAEGDLNQLTIEASAHTSSVTTSNLTLAAIVYGCA